MKNRSSLGKDSPYDMDRTARVKYSVLLRASDKEYRQLKDAPAEWLDQLYPTAVQYGPYFREVDSILNQVSKTNWHPLIVERVMDSYEKAALPMRSWTPAPALQNLHKVLRSAGRNDMRETLWEDERYYELENLNLDSSALLETITNVLRACAAYDLIGRTEPAEARTFTFDEFKKVVAPWNQFFRLPRAFGFVEMISMDRGERIEFFQPPGTDFQSLVPVK